MGLYGTTKNAERVEFGLVENESHRERMGMKQRNQFRNPPSHPPSPKTLKILLDQSNG